MGKNKKLATRIALVGAASCLALAAAPVLAQESSEGDGLTEIVVTAQKRSEGLQSVPVTVSAIAGSQLEDLRMSQAQDVAAQMPNVEIKNTLGNSNPVVSIRGVSMNDFSANNSQSAGVYVDETFFVSPAMMGFQLYDLDRVEVLKGPQGTLYGRNTTAGAIKFITKAPSTKAGDNYFQVGYGRYKTFEAEGGINLPISDTLIGRISGQLRNREGGYIHNTFTGNKEYGEIHRVAGRFELAWDPSSNVSALLSVHGGRDRSDSMATWKARGTDCAEYAATGLPAPGCPDFLGYVDPDFDDPYTGAWGSDPKVRMDSYGGSLKLDVTTGRVVITSVTSYEKFKRHLEEDADGSPLSGFDILYKNDIDQFSQELRLATKDIDLVDLIAGVFYSKDTIGSQPAHGINSFDFIGANISLFYKQKTEASAAFAHSTWHLTDRLNMTAGLRFTHEKRRFDGEVDGFLEDGTPLGLFDFGFGPIEQHSTFKDDNLSGKIGLDFSPNDDTLIYASVARGFKSGGYPGTVVISSDALGSYDSETLTAYEAGLKLTLLDGKMHWNTAAFYYDYKNMQLFNFDPNSGFIRLTNATKAKIKGLDSDLTWRIVRPLTLNLGMGVLDTENQDPAFAGLRLPNAPKFSLNGSLTYKTEFENGMGLSAVIGFDRVGEMYKGAENMPSQHAAAYTLVNARLGLDINEHVNLSVWGTNIFSKKYMAEIFNQADLIGDVIYNWGAPADFGASLTVRW